MTDGMGFVHPVEMIFLDRVTKEEGSRRDLPRKRRDEKMRPLRSEGAKNNEQSEDVADSTPSNHIDLRI